MSLQNFSFFAFLAVAAAVYLALPKKAQTPFLFAASLVFYGCNLYAAWQAALAVPGGTVAEAAFRCAVSAGLVGFVGLFVWRMALALAAAEPPRRGRLLCGAVLTLLLVLAVFKYYNLSPLPALFAGTLLGKLPFPLGISFFTFAAISYLADVARGDCAAEPRFIHTFTYLFFFATVTSGPICRGGQILPQLRAEHRFDAARTVRFFRLFAVGLFEKVAVADVLGLFVNQVFNTKAMPGYGAPILIVALILYTFQLYFDFAGYSDMARAAGLLLGIELPENFKTPFFATNFSGFWARWHISLSGWLQDYLFMPLAWADVRKTPLLGRPLARKWEHFPVEFCVFVVFFASGFWHGNTLPFVVWGLLQAVYRVGEELCHRRFGRPKKKGVAPAVLWAKRCGVFCLWAGSMVFFRVGSGPNTDTASLADCGRFFAGLFRGWAPARFVQEFFAAVAAGFYAKPIMELAWCAFTAFGLAILFYLDSQRFFRFHGKPIEAVLAGQKPAVKWLLYYALVLGILAGMIIQNGGFGGGTSFAYAGF
ncbi:MAG: hypothetical protein LKJ90_04805 [Faecalibacterium sp.]|jgi:D-alanyl-lipoteichoic acid acyltransferase DltB (MBOAT superfamily)|nr:hypothetical protein [Faecalibacterium sp.]